MRPSALRAPLLISAALAPIVLDYPTLLAQGITTAGIQGEVRATDGTDVDGTEIVVVNTATGYVADGEVRDGRFFISGLEVGGPYRVTARRFGFHPQQSEPVLLKLGESLQLDFELQPDAIPQDTLRVALRTRSPTAFPDAGTATTIPDSLLHRLPSLNRDFHDFVRLVPQISTRVGFPRSLSGGGVGFRFNDFLINGSSERGVAAHGTRASLGGKSLPLEAVKEYQVMIAPYDVEYGDFAGALVNTVTRAGTNEVEGTTFGYWTSDRLARIGDEDLARPYDRLQYGFSLGGPILRDRLHYYMAAEFQHFASPAAGPYLGQPQNSPDPILVTASDLERFDEILRGYGLVAGSAGQFDNENPVTSVFARFDYDAPAWNSRAVLWGLYGSHSVNDRSRSSEDFTLSTYEFNQEGQPDHLAFQLHTAIGRGGEGQNEFLASHRSVRVEFEPDVDQPIVRVAFPPTEEGHPTVTAGTHETAHGTLARFWSLNIEDHLMLPLGADHLVRAGFALERFRDVREGLPGAYGSWTFSSLDSLGLGIADRYEIPRDFRSANIPITGTEFSAYARVRWQAGERFTLKMGLRADALSIEERPPYNAAVDSIFQRRTDEMPAARIHLSPRASFVWNLSGTGEDQLRGGVGIFTGRPPAHWYRAALSRYGIGVGTLRCGSLPSDLGPAPTFVPDYRNAPMTCANGVGLSDAPRGFDVDLLSQDLRMTQSLRASIAYDRHLAGNLKFTGEVLVTKMISDFVFVNLNLEGPQATDRNGRVLYGTIGTDGLAEPALRSEFSEVIDLVNTSRNRSLQLSASVESEFSNGIGGMASYTHTWARDAQTPLDVGTPGRENWASRAISGRHDDLSPGISLNDIPHRIVLAGTYEAPWERWRTIVSLSFVGESGSPFTYLAWGLEGQGDLNADGSSGNDPVHVPRDAFDTDEIMFSGLSDIPEDDNSEEAQAERIEEQAGAFERFIDDVSCLRNQQGEILERNSCREPWSHTADLSVRQTIPVGSRMLEAELQIFNVLNALNSGWGVRRVADPALLEHVGQTEGPPDESHSIFRFDPNRTEWSELRTESAYQIQFALRYSF